jgi:hypothetical protein
MVAESTLLDPTLVGAVVPKQWQIDAGQVCPSDSVIFRKSYSVLGHIF